MTWLMQNRAKFGGEIHSLKLLSETIGQALTENAKVANTKEKARRQNSPREEVGTNQQVSVEKEAMFRHLSEKERDDLQELAVARLVRAGYKADVVRELKLLVQNEMLRIIEEKAAAPV